MSSWTKNKFLYLRKAFAGKANEVIYSNLGIPRAYHFSELVCWYQGIDDEMAIKKKADHYDWQRKIQKALSRNNF